MDGLIVLFFIAVVISSLSKSKKNSQQQKRAMDQRKQSMQQFARPASPASVKPAAPRPAAPKPMMMSVKPVAVPVQPSAEPMQPAPAMPTVQVTRHTDDIFEGSMAMESTEGYDPCHEEDLQEAVTPCELAPDDTPAPAAATDGLDLEWTGSAMVKAMVMQEVLTRPCDRLRR